MVSVDLLDCTVLFCFFFFQAEDGIRDLTVTGVQTCALPILHPARYVAGDRPDALAFASPGSDTVRYEDGLGEFEIRLLLEQHLGDASAAALFATGWDGDRYQVLGRRKANRGGGAGGDALVWYTLWDNKGAAARFKKGLESAWAKRRSGGSPGRRSQIKQQ